MEKHVIDRRVTQMEAEGVTFHYGVHVGGKAASALDPQEMLNDYDALALTGGAEAARDLPIPGRELAGIHFAMDFLPQQNRRVSSEPLGSAPEILASGKHVVVIGGGDTGSDCIGTSFRQGALSVTQLEIMPAPPERENKGLTWPNWPLKMRTSSSQAEGARREYAVLTQKFSGADGKVAKMHCVQVDDKFKPVPGSEFELEAQLVLLAMGFVHPVHEGLLKTLGVELDPRGNVQANTSDYQTSRPNVFSAGDMRRGQSLVVWAIREGRLCARAIDQFLMGTTSLPR
jgi:glutamate synthase (NADPH/NADH) small chain